MLLKSCQSYVVETGAVKRQPRRPCYKDYPSTSGPFPCSKEAADDCNFSFIQESAARRIFCKLC
jgi:hypothetical protein